MATKLFTFTDRDAAHAQLDELVKSGLHPAVECREDANKGEIYIYDGPEPWSDRAPRPDTPLPVSLALSDAALDSLAGAIAARVAVLLGPLLPPAKG